MADRTITEILELADYSELDHAETLTLVEYETRTAVAKALASDREKKRRESNERRRESLERALELARQTSSAYEPPRLEVLDFG